MPRGALTRTLNALGVPAGVIADTGEALHLNDRLRADVPAFAAADVETPLKEVLLLALGVHWDQTAIGRLLDGGVAEGAVEAMPSAVITGGICVASWLPDVQGWPLVAMWTLHQGPDSVDRAVDLHLRDKLAATAAIQIDEAVQDARMAVLTVNSAFSRLDNLVDVWCDRIEMTERQLPQR